VTLLEESGPADGDAMIAAAGLKILVSAEPGRGLLVYPFKYLPLLAGACRGSGYRSTKKNPGAEATVSEFLQTKNKANK
jgi:hypothetical protein